MQRITSYKIASGFDSTQCRTVNWFEEAGHIAFIENQVRFYNAVGFVNSHYKVYIPQQGEHLEITGKPAGEDEEYMNPSNPSPSQLNC